MLEPTAWYLVEKWIYGDLEDKRVIDNALEELSDMETRMRPPAVLFQLLSAQFLNEKSIAVVDTGEQKYGLSNGTHTALEFDNSDIVEALRYCFSFFGKVSAETLLFSLMKVVADRR